MSLEFAHGAVQWLSTDAASTTYVVSGLTFQPKALRFYWVGAASATDSFVGADVRRGMGFAASPTSRRAVAAYSQDGSSGGVTASIANNNCVAVVVDNTAAVTGLLDLASINSDGFTLVVDDQIPANLTVFWEAWGGTDITHVTVGDITEPGATGTQNYTAYGFTPDGANQVLLIAGSWSTAALNTGTSANGALCVGYATDTNPKRQIVLSNQSQNGATPTNCDGWNRDGEVLSLSGSSGGSPTVIASLSGWGLETFTLNWTARDTTRKFIYLAIKGGNWQAGDLTFSAATAGSVVTLSGLPFTLTGISILARNEKRTSPSSVDKYCIGTASGLLNRRSMCSGDRDGQSTSVAMSGVDYDSVASKLDVATETMQSYWDIDQWGSNSVRIISEGGTGLSNDWLGYLAFGSSSPSSIFMSSAVKRFKPSSPGVISSIWLAAGKDPEE